MAFYKFQRSTYAPLLDRLADPGGDGIGGQGVFQQAGEGHRGQVLRDVSRLLNARALHPMGCLGPYSCARQSVLNYGLPDLAGKTRSQVNDDEIARMIRHALESFEPRLEQGTLRVVPVSLPEEKCLACLSFLVEGTWRSLPVSEQLLLRTDLDLETGQFDVYYDDHGP